MSTIPGLRYQPHSRGNKPFVILKDKPSKPRPFYLPKTDETGHQGHGQTYKKNRAFTRNGKLYQDQIATLDIPEDEEEIEENEKEGGKKPEKGEERNQSEYSGDTNSSNTPRMVTTIGLWSKEQDDVNNEQVLSYTLPSVAVDVTSLEQPDSESLSSSRASRVVFTRNRADDEPVYATVIKDPMESRLSIPDDQEENTDNDTFVSGSFIRTPDSEAQQFSEQEKQPSGTTPNPGLQNIENLLTSDEDIGIVEGLRDQNQHPFPSIHKLSEETGEKENSNQLRKRIGRGPVLVNKQSGAYLDKTADRYSDDDNSQTYDYDDNNTAKGIHVYPTVNVQEVVVKEKSHSHSVPTLILYHTDTDSGVRLRSDVTQRRNIEYSNPALVMPFQRDSPDLAHDLLNRRSKSKQDKHPGTEFVPKQSSMYKVPQIKETQSMEEASMDSRSERETDDENTKSTEDEDDNNSANDSGNQEGVREYYHGNRGFHDSILNPPLTVARIPNHLNEDDMNLNRRPSYMLGKLVNGKYDIYLFINLLYCYFLGGA